MLQLMDSLLQLAMSGQQTSAMMKQLALYAVKLIVARASSVDKEHFIRVSFVHVLHSNCGPFVSCGVLVYINFWEDFSNEMFVTTVQSS